jgi:transposase
MAWTAEDRRTYAPAIQEMVRQGMIVRLARTIEAIDPQPGIGRPRVWSSLIMLQALWHLARDGCAWRRLPPAFPPRTTVWSRLDRWRKLKVLERALAAPLEPPVRLQPCGTDDRLWRSWSPAIAWRAVGHGGRPPGSSTRRA